MAEPREEAVKYHELVARWTRVWSEEEESSSVARGHRLTWLGWQMRTAYVNTVMAILFKEGSDGRISELVSRVPDCRYCTARPWLKARLAELEMGTPHDALGVGEQTDLIQMAASLLWLGDIGQES